MALSIPTLLATATVQNSGGTASLATGSVSPASDCLLIVAGNDDSGVGETFTMSTTLANVGTWTVIPLNYTGVDFAYIAYAKVTGAPGSGTVTTTFTQGPDSAQFQLFSVTGHNTTTPVQQNKTASGTADPATITLTSTPAATSEVFALTARFFGSTGGSKAMTPSGTEIGQNYLNNTAFSFDLEMECQYVNGSAGTTHTCATLGTTPTWGMIAIEINAAATAAADAPPPIPAIGPGSQGPQAWQWRQLHGIDATVITSDVSVAGLLPLAADLPAAAVPLSTVSHDAALVGMLPAAAVPIGTISHDATVAGLLPAAVAPVGTITHAATVAGILPVGVVPLATFTHDATLAGLLFVGAVPLSTVSHDASVAGLLPVAAVPYGPVSHTATVAGLLPLGAIFLSQLAGDLSTIGVLYAGLEGHGLISHAATVAGILHVGAVPASPVTHDAALSGLLPAAALPYAPVSHTTSVAGVLPVGLTPIGTVSHQVALVGLLPVGGVLYALVTVAGPDAPDLHPILWIYREAGPLHFTESGLLYVEAAALEATEGPRLTGRDLWITYRETP
jgi:hypothetical protein